MIPGNIWQLTLHLQIGRVTFKQDAKIILNKISHKNAKKLELDFRKKQTNKTDFDLNG